MLMALPAPTNANIPACTGALAGFGRCAPLMVFRHGLGGGRADMLDRREPVHGGRHGRRRDRCCRSTAIASFCTPMGTAGQCAGDSASATTCVTSLPMRRARRRGAAGHVPGWVPVPAGQPVGAGESRRVVRRVRVRGGRPGRLRQLPHQHELLPHARHVPAGHDRRVAARSRGRRSCRRARRRPVSRIFDTVFGYSTSAAPNWHAFIVDPAKVYFSGQSLGSIQGAADVATNPRISKAGFNVGGGTIVDVFTELAGVRRARPISYSPASASSPARRRTCSSSSSRRPCSIRPIRCDFVGHVTREHAAELVERRSGQQAPKTSCRKRRTAIRRCRTRGT